MSQPLAHTQLGLTQDLEAMVDDFRNLLQEAVVRATSPRRPVVQPWAGVDRGVGAAGSYVGTNDGSSRMLHGAGVESGRRTAGPATVWTGRATSPRGGAGTPRDAQGRFVSVERPRGPGGQYQAGPARDAQGRFLSDAVAYPRGSQGQFMSRATSPRGGGAGMARPMSPRGGCGCGGVGQMPPTVIQRTAITRPGSPRRY